MPEEPNPTTLQENEILLQSKLAKWRENSERERQEAPDNKMMEMMSGLLGVIASSKEVSQTLGTKEAVEKFTKHLDKLSDKVDKLTNKPDPDQSEILNAVSEVIIGFKEDINSVVDGLKKQKPPKITVPAAQVSVPAPEVTVEAPDFTKIEKKLDQSFTKIARSISDSKPEFDLTPLIEKMDQMSDKLTSIDTATRMKPLPGSMKVTNSDGSAVFSTPTFVPHGSTTITTAGNKVILSESTPLKSVTIKALVTNTGIIYVGGVNVSSSNGFQLSAGETVNLDIDDVNKIYLDSSVNSEGVTWLGVR